MIDTSFTSIGETLREWVHGCRALNLLEVPFKIKRIFEQCIASIFAKSISGCIRSSLEAVAEVGATFGTVINSLNVLKSVKVITDAPHIPFLNFILLPFIGLKTVFDSWDLIKTIKTFWVIRGGVSNREEAIEKLKALKVDEAKESLRLSEQCKLAEKVDSLMKKLQKGKAGALDEARAFYEKMQGRAGLQLSISIARTACTIMSFVGEILLAAVPFIPFIGSSLMALGGLGYTSISVIVAFFVKDDIFDKKAHTLASKICAKVADVFGQAGKVASKVAKFFQSLTLAPMSATVPCTTKVTG